MSNFNEASLEQAIIELFVNENYIYMPGASVHKELTDVILKDDLFSYLKNRYQNEKITENEINSIISLMQNALKMPLYDANKQIMKYISDGFILKREDRSKKDFHVSLINYEEPLKNNFKFINQLEIKNIETRIPDGLVFVNGLPLVIFEFKSAIKEEINIHHAYEQVTVRYRRSIPDLLKFNAFVVLSDGVNTKYGSLFAKYDFYYSWRKIDGEGKELDGIDSLITLVKGLFNKERFIDVVHNFIYFPDKSDKEIKFVCRYPQYYGSRKLFDSIKKGLRPNGDGKGGTYFGATGCGKSMTMLFLSRLIMRDQDLESPTILLITDRNDLDKQLAKLFVDAKDYLGDKCIKKIESRDALRIELKDRPSGGVFLTTIQKFTEDTTLLSDRMNIICISDEAHRTQVNVESKYKRTDKGVTKSYGFAKYLHDSLPMATYVGFTGTPIDATLDVFGKVSDSYTMSESVNDGITVNIVYEGRSAKVLLDSEKVKEIEKYYQECADLGSNEYQIEESQKTVSKLEVIIGDDNRLEAVAQDIVNHYERRVFEKSTVNGKAMIVCMDRFIAFRLYKKIINLRKEWSIAKTCADGIEISESDRRELKEIPFINLVMTRDKDDPKELFDLLGNKSDREELDRQFKNDKSNFKIAIVVDMWLTGFDVPSLDTMYIDKPLQEHTLIQTISRVNRVYPGKEKGLVVDYFGIKSQMNLALKKFNTSDKEIFEGIEASVKIVKDELDILNRIFKDFNMTLFFSGTPLEKLNTLKKAAEYVQLTDEIEKRFMAQVKRLKSAFNLCSMSEKISENERDLVYFYGAVRSIIFKLTIGDVPDLTQMNETVRKMIQEAITSEGVEELFVKNKDVKGREIDIFSNDYLEKISRIPLKNTKVKILAKLANDAIEEYKKVNKIKGVEFGVRLQKLIDSYNLRQDEKVYADQVLDNVADELAKLLKELNKDKKSFIDLGVDFEEKAFFDILESIAQKYEFYDEYISKWGKDELINLAKEMKIIVDDKAKYTDWSKKEDIKAELKVDIILKMAEFHYPPVTKDEVFKEIFEQAENFKKYN